MATAYALDHLVLVVAEVERTLAWYGRHAGLPVVRVDEWRAGEVPFPSLRVDDATIIDVIPGNDDPDQRGHLDHICLVVSRADLDALAADPDLEVVDSGVRFGARGDGQSIYVRDPDHLLVEFRAYD
jgi:catechol 2,3-dioxygenase-like lactoylglutathione lyase family enzyme